MSAGESCQGWLDELDALVLARLAGHVPDGHEVALHLLDQDGRVLHPGLELRIVDPVDIAYPAAGVLHRRPDIAEIVAHRALVLHPRLGFGNGPLVLVGCDELLGLRIPLGRHLAEGLHGFRHLRGADQPLAGLLRIALHQCQSESVLGLDILVFGLLPQLGDGRNVPGPRLLGCLLRGIGLLNGCDLDLPGDRLLGLLHGLEDAFRIGIGAGKNLQLLVCLVAALVNLASELYDAERNGHVLGPPG